MTTLSVNINKVATLRNARGGQIPNVVQVACDCERFGANGITVHPRPDGRHIRYQDVYDLKAALTVELNIEGYPSAAFIELVKRVLPTQVTLVPDAPDAITSNAGWDCIKHQAWLSELTDTFQAHGIRVSLFVGTELDNIAAAAATHADRIELYTEPYAAAYATDASTAVAPFVNAATYAAKLGLAINAGHDLNLDNLQFLSQNIPFLSEVSIGHALIADALYMGLEATIAAYKKRIG
ncbi:MAG: pyridoxine 5'-phosphate synthase [Prevotellaceae bacterium]|jgi:pyridoxine 5-phosphate synthase|nr:pyridoxine 5'-phosphate synthase [Prevotellaceae bacterium]